MKTPSRSHILLLATTGLTALFTAFPAKAQPLEIKQVWVAGKTYVQSVEIQQRSAVPLGLQTMDQELQITTETSTSVLPSQSGKILSVRQARMNFQVKMAEQTLTFDSSKPTEDSLGLTKFYQKLSETPVQIQLNAQDEPLKLLNAGSLIPQGEAFENPAAQLFNPDSVLDSLRQSSLRTQPSGPVSPGESWKWSFSQEVPMAGSLNASGNYTFKSLTEKDGVRCAEISMEGTLTHAPSSRPSGPSAPEAEILKAMGLKISSGKLTGTLWFDPALGAVKEAVIDQDLELTLQNPALPEGKLVVPTHSRIRSTLKSVTDTP